MNKFINQSAVRVWEPWLVIRSTTVVLNMNETFLK